MLIEGIFPPITTPFYPGGELYFKKLEHNVEYYSRTPAAGLVVLGSTGEAVMLRESEQIAVLETAARIAAPDKVLIAGVGQESVLATLHLADHAARLDYDVVLVRTPHYYRAQMRPAEMLHYYRMVADRSALPVLLYSIPTCTGYELPVEIIAELSSHGNIIGIKDSSGNPERIGEMVKATSAVKRAVTVTPTFAAVTRRMATAASESAAKNLISVESLGGSISASAAIMSPPMASSLKTRTREVGFQVLAGSAATFHASLQAGAVGGILALACCAPQACYEVFAAHKEGNPPLAALKQERLVPAARRIVGEMGIPAIKYAAELNGYYGGPPRDPLLPLRADEKAEVERLMQSLRA
jgi:4-hydroxy-2-oxoglutarate aldolase